MSSIQGCTQEASATMTMVQHKPHNQESSSTNLQNDSCLQMPPLSESKEAVKKLPFVLATIRLLLEGPKPTTALVSSGNRN